MYPSVSVLFVIQLMEAIPVAGFTVTLSSAGIAGGVTSAKISPSILEEDIHPEASLISTL